MNVVQHMEFFRRYKKKFLFLLVIVFSLELFVFNYRHWESLPNKEIQIKDFIIGSGYQNNGNGTYTVVGDDISIEITGLDFELRTACIEMAVKENKGEMPVPVVLRQWVRDESHQLYYGLPEREIWENEKRSSYMTYHLYGKCKGLKLYPALSYGQTLSFFITLNPQIPLFFSWERIFVLIVLCGMAAALRPSSHLYKITYIQLPYGTKSVLLVAFFLVHELLFWELTHLNPFFQEEILVNQKQYQTLAESLKEGHFFLTEEPPQSLKNMENPYDYEYRNQVMNQAGEWYKWDHAYYNGKYYVYFGIVPVLVLYLPCYLITGVHLHNFMAIFIFSLLFLAGLLGTVHEILQKWFPKTSLGVWFLLMELILTGSGILYMTKRPDLYTVPILSGLAFGLLGLWCFLRGIRENGVSLKYLAAGSLLTALVAGCRPQLLMLLLPVFFILWKHLLPVRNKLPAVLAFCVPMLFIAAALMYYNYSRFGSVFDFGANYNLTMNDMRRRGFQLDRIPTGVIAYLLQPVRLALRFPFAEAVYFNSQYMGVTIQEATYGGIFMTSLFAWFGILPVLFRRELIKQRKTAWQVSVACLFAAGVIIVADTNMSGILQRYFGDFSIFIMLSSALSVLLIFSYLQQTGEGFKRIVIWLLLICLLWQIAYQGMIFFLDTGESLKELRPDLYSHAKYLTEFWL